MKVRTENDNNFGYGKITILVDNMPLNSSNYFLINESVNIEFSAQNAFLE